MAPYEPIKICHILQNDVRSLRRPPLCNAQALVGAFEAFDKKNAELIADVEALNAEKANDSLVLCLGGLRTWGRKVGFYRAWVHWRIRATYIDAREPVYPGV